MTLGHTNLYTEKNIFIPAHYTSVSTNVFGLQTIFKYYFLFFYVDCLKQLFGKATPLLCVCCTTDTSRVQLFFMFHAVPTYILLH